MAFRWNIFTNDFDIVEGSNQPPFVPTSFITQDGTAVPIANELEIFGAPRPNLAEVPDDDNGIATYRDSVDTNKVNVYLTNRATATVQTTNATTTEIFSIDLGGTAGGYTVWGEVTAYEPSGENSGSYFYQGGFKTDGVTASIVSVENVGEYEDVALNACNIDFSVSGNDAVLEVTGLAATTINWDLQFFYRFRD